MEKIRVLVVDDSAFMRKIISEMIASEPDMEVAGTARDGVEALEKTAALAPDVVTLDVEMPRMDGLTALARLMNEAPCPVVMVSSQTQENAAATIKSLALGAVDFVPKPSGAISLDMRQQRDSMLQKLRVAAKVPRERLRRSGRQAGPGLTLVGGRPSAGGGAPAPVIGPAPQPLPRSTALSRVVVIGASTGGPSALMEVISHLPAGFPAGVLVVQHMPPGFTRSLAQHLNTLSALTVREAGEGDILTDGQCLVAPGGHHLVLRQDGRVSMDDSPPQHGVKPAVDVTLESVAKTWSQGAVVVILTGMGLDGARGARTLKQIGGQVIAQDEASCVVYGMPRAVVELGVADHVTPLKEVAGQLCRLVGHGAAEGGAGLGGSKSARV